MSAARAGLVATGGRLAQDIHIHTNFSDDAVSPLRQVVTEAEQQGLRRICISEHVHRTTRWLPYYVDEIQVARFGTQLNLRAGVEAKLLDVAGSVDVPDDLTGIDRVLIADHQFPGKAGPVSPRRVAAQIATGELPAAEAVETLVEATCRAISRVPGPVLAHLFSVLPKIGLTEADVPGPLLSALADTAARYGAILDVNERWQCPSAAVVQRFLAAGVEVAAGSDSHRAPTVGRFAWAKTTLMFAVTDSLATPPQPRVPPPLPPWPPVPPAVRPSG